MSSSLCGCGLATQRSCVQLADLDNPTAQSIESVSRPRSQPSEACGFDEAFPFASYREVSSVASLCAVGPPVECHIH